MFFAACSNVSSRHASRPVSLAVKGFAADASLIQADANNSSLTLTTISSM
jgi:hypothetical protein